MAWESLVADKVGALGISGSTPKGAGEVMLGARKRGGEVKLGAIEEGAGRAYGHVPKGGGGGGVEEIA